ncbi:hypothetical protein K4K53_007742 [Colletotrichum sp. SAR 10_77]|nr:hypothetical protein K4K51_008356 [Colletotrichum sp. SAR 10_75]KAI8220487.1 hypothetical protein K4K53_007742 [Colletotrichum sp. SAR 10_77]
MSDQMPDMVAAEEIPYCIWYPDVASEQTYYKLHQRYPQMRYQIGRACAAAGYISLYKQLDLLPDKWSVMDDYTRSILLENPPPARYGLNGDTAVRSTLTLRRRYEKPGLFSRFGEGNYRPLEYGEHVPPYFNITEDWNIDEFDSALAEPIDMRVEARSAPNTEEMMQLLWNALPLDLPEGNKDILILMSAYYGDIDRYQRLRRPNYMLEAESSCIIRGIYHNTMFAKWMSLQPDNDRFRRAINARFIMSNDVSRITSDTPEWALPYLIWYPARACGPTYEEIVRRRPEMKHAVARACIVADYGPEWDRLNADPSPELFCEAKASSNPYYLEDLRRSFLFL